VRSAVAVAGSDARTDKSSGELLTAEEVTAVLRQHGRIPMPDLLAHFRKRIRGTPLGVSLAHGLVLMASIAGSEQRAHLMELLRQLVNLEKSGGMSFLQLKPGL
jgi:hypothetical protein